MRGTSGCCRPLPFRIKKSGGRARASPSGGHMGARPTAPFPSLWCSLLNSTNRRPIRAAFSFGRSMGNAGPALPGGWRKGLCSILPPDSSAERSFMRRMPMRPVIGIQAGEANAALLEGSGGLHRRRMAAAIPSAGKAAGPFFCKRCWLFKRVDDGYQRGARRRGPIPLRRWRAKADI